jgi:uncharacterized membrane protein
VVLVVSYHRWRAVWAIALPFVALTIPAVNLLLNPADFRVRWIDEWVSTAFFGFGLVWFIYALWPSAFRFLANGPEEVTVDADALIFNSSKRYNLNALSAVEILRPWLQPPLVALQFGRERVTIETAYQPIGEKRSAEAIANAIAEASRR